MINVSNISKIFRTEEIETEVMTLLQELNQEGATIVMVTHSQKDASMAQRTIDLFDGKIVSDVKNEL